MDKPAPAPGPTRAPCLDLAEWHERTCALCEGAAEAGWDEQGDCLREAYALVTLAPRMLGQWLLELPPQLEFDTMLAAQCWDSAALALLPADAGYMVSRGGEAECLASVILPGAGEEFTARAQHPALAVVAALSGALVAACPRGDAVFSPGDSVDLAALPRHTGWLH
jgi:hypothetical protein